MLVTTYKEEQTNVLNFVQTTYKMTAAHITACAILTKQVLWNFVQNPNTSLVRFHLTINTARQPLNIPMIQLFSIRTYFYYIKYVNACQITRYNYFFFYSL